MDVHDRLNQLTATIRNAKPMPMSASCLVNRAEMLDILEKLRDELPAEMDHADAVLSEREALLAGARAQAERILEGARTQRDQLIEQTDVLAAAQVRAASVTAQARAESTRLLTEADGYVDRKLSDFQVMIDHLAAQVNNGRLRLTSRREADLSHFQPAAKDGARVNVAMPAIPAIPAETAAP